jgi:HEAT repeat protein
MDIKRENRSARPSRCRGGATFGSLIVVCLAIGPASGIADAPAANGDAADAPLQSPRPRQTLRYAGRTFADWRDQLVNDLESDTRIKAMPALAAFGRHGYADEAAAALAEALDSDDDKVINNAANHLVMLGQPAVAPLLTALERQGTNERADVVRMHCLFSLGRLGPRAADAADTLRELAEHGPARVAAIEALATIAAGDERYLPLFKRLLDDGDEHVRRAAVVGVAAGLLKHDPESLTLLLGLAEDADPSIRRHAAQALAFHGPADDEVIAALKRLLRDEDQEVSGTLLNELVVVGNRPATVVPVLVDALTAPELLGKVVRSNVGQMIDVLGRAGDQAALAVPLLIDVIEDRLPELGPAAVPHAIDALGKLGPAAQEAVAALERRAAADPLTAPAQQVLVYTPAAGPQEASLRSRARRALHRIMHKPQASEPAATHLRH